MPAGGGVGGILKAGAAHTHLFTHMELTFSMWSCRHGASVAHTGNEVQNWRRGNAEPKSHVAVDCSKGVGGHYRVTVGYLKGDPLMQVRFPGF